MLNQGKMGGAGLPMCYKWGRDQGWDRSDLRLRYQSVRDPVTGKAKYQTLASTTGWRLLRQEELAYELQAMVHKAIRKGREHSDALGGCLYLNDWQCAMETAHVLMTTPAGGRKAAS